MTRLTALIGMLGATAVAFSAGATVAHAKTEIKVGTGLIRMHDQIVVYFDLFENPINADPNAPVKLKYLGGPEITPRKQLGPALKRGLLEILVSPASYYAGLVPEARYAAISNRSDHELRANGAYALLQKAWKKGLNARILAWPYWHGTQFHIYLNRRPKLSKKTGISLAGLRMRTISLYTPFLKAMGATPVTISPGEVYTGLQRGVVAGLAWPEGAITKYGWQKYIKVKVEPGFWRSSTMVVINLDKWHALTQKARDYLDKWSLKLEDESGPAQRKVIDVDNAKVYAAGVKQMKLDPAHAKAYLHTIFGATWNDAKKRKMTVPYATFRAKLYKE